jgi:hypothetical protein
MVPDSESEVSMSEQPRAGVIFPFLLLGGGSDAGRLEPGHCVSGPELSAPDLGRLGQTWKERWNPHRRPPQQEALLDSSSRYVLTSLDEFEPASAAPLCSRHPWIP